MLWPPPHLHTPLCPSSLVSEPGPGDDACAGSNEGGGVGGGSSAAAAAASQRVAASALRPRRVTFSSIDKLGPMISRNLQQLTGNRTRPGRRHSSLASDAIRRAFERRFAPAAILRRAGVWGAMTNASHRRRAPSPPLVAKFALIVHGRLGGLYQGPSFTLAKSDGRPNSLGASADDLAQAIATCAASHMEHIVRANSGAGGVDVYVRSALPRHRPSAPLSGRAMGGCACGPDGGDMGRYGGDMGEIWSCACGPEGCAAPHRTSLQAPRLALRELGLRLT